MPIASTRLRGWKRLFKIFLYQQFSGFWSWRLIELWSLWIDKSSNLKKKTIRLGEITSLLKASFSHHFSFDSVMFQPLSWCSELFLVFAAVSALSYDNRKLFHPQKLLLRPEKKSGWVCAWPTCYKRFIETEQVNKEVH